MSIYLLVAVLFVYFAVGKKSNRKSNVRSHQQDNSMFTTGGELKGFESQVSGMLVDF